MKKYLVRLVVLGLVFVVLVGFTSISFAQEEVIPGEYYNLSDYEELTGEKIAEFNESPMLAELVEQGKLPPVEERLPNNPLVVTPYEEIGQYGGTWRRSWTGLADQWGPNKLCHEHLLMFDKLGNEILPGVAESWGVSEDAKVYTFKLREGIKWSDGVPLTTDDVMFWYEDVMLNEELTPIFPVWLTSRGGGEPCEIEKVDTYTFRVKFAQPNPLFPMTICKFGYPPYCFFLPKHYVKQFHPKYTPIEELEGKVREAGLESWHQLFGMKCLDSNAWLQNPELPVVYPWKSATLPTVTTMKFERNPYYWKIDPAGNQLPYIDMVTHMLVENTEVTLMKVLSGEIDMQTRGLVLTDYPLLMENRDKGNYRVLFWKGGSGAGTTVEPNQNVGDPVLRELFEDKRFRQALSIAINRDEINQIVYLGLGKPRQASLISGVKFYDPEWEKKWAEYDPEKANQLLDELGLTERDNGGYRLRSDGKTLALTITYNAAAGQTSDTLELIKGYWEAVGIKVALQPVDRSLYEIRWRAGDTEIATASFDRCTAIMSDPGRLLGTESPWAPLYALWYTSDGKGGEEPKGDIRRIYELWDEIQVTADEKQRDELFKEIVNLHKENIWIIGTVGEIPQPVAVKNNFRNVPDGEIYWDDTVRAPKNARPEQFFFEK